MPPQESSPPKLHRRTIVLGAVGATLVASSPRTLAQAPAPARGPGDTIHLAQLLDASQDQQEVSRDYSTGLRLAANDFNRTSKKRIQLVAFQSDGTAGSLKSVMASVRKDASLAAFVGTAGERLGLNSIQAARAEGLAVAHLAPWMSDSRFDADRDVVSIFASREAQIRFALKSLEALGIVDIGVVYSSAQEFAVLRSGVEAASTLLKLRPVVYAPQEAGDVTAMGAKLPAASPVVLLFLGGTVELSLFAQALSARKLQRYIVSLANIDVGTLVQLGTGRAVPLILTQVVPNPQTSTLPAVRDYRSSLKLQFDESPSQISLAGYLAGRYLFPILARMERPATRENVLAEFERRPSEDLGGFQIGFSPSQRRGSSFVTQTYLTAEGRQIG